jgi:hypothetical protein
MMMGVVGWPSHRGDDGVCSVWIRIMDREEEDNCGWNEARERLSNGVDFDILHLYHLHQL